MAFNNLVSLKCYCVSVCGVGCEGVGTPTGEGLLIVQACAPRSIEYILDHVLHNCNSSSNSSKDVAFHAVWSCLPETVQPARPHNVRTGDIISDMRCADG